MDLQAIVQAVSSVGFPIVACAVMWKQQGKLTDTLHEINQNLTLMNERIKEIEDKTTYANYNE